MADRDDANQRDGMTGEKGEIDLSLTFGELTAGHPELRDSLLELGFEDLDEGRTIPQLCEEAGVDLAIVAFALSTEGYEVQGYQSTDGGAAAGMLDTVFSALFDPESDAMPDGASSQGPMFAHMEAAIRRAQKSGELPSD